MQKADFTRPGSGSHWGDIILAVPHCSVIVGINTLKTNLPLMTKKYIEKILSARVYDVAIETPLELSKTLSSRLENKVLLKREDLQSVFSFKLRGAYNCIFQLSRKKS